MRDIHQFKAAATALTSGWIPKGVVAFLSGLVAFILPTETAGTLAWACLTLLVLDTLTGTRAAWIEGSQIKSASLSRVLTKLLGYCSILVVAAIAGESARSVGAADQAKAVLVTASLGFIAMTEGVSVLENVDRMGVAFPQWLSAWIRKFLNRGPDVPS